jgi:superfamily II DNA helicase RecQ
MEFCWDARVSAIDASQAAGTTTATNDVPSSTELPSHTAIKATICYLAQFAVVVCKQHATALQNVDAHLRDYHNAPKKLRRQIVESFQGKTVLLPKDVPLPHRLGQPVEELGLPQDGYSCSVEDCRFLTVSIDKLRMHRNKDHKLPWKGDQHTLYEKVKVQTLFRTGGLQRYFIVNTEERTSEPAVSHEDVDVIQRHLAEYSSFTQREEEREQRLEKDVPKTDRTNWFNFTQWPVHLAGRNLEHLAYQIRLPDRSEPRLQRAVKLTEELVEKSVSGLSTLHRDTRRWLRSAKREEMDLRPLARLQNPSSQARYAGYMARFVCYFLRITADEIAGGAKQFLRKGNTSMDDEDRHNEAIYNAESDMSDDETSGSDAESNSDSDGRSSLHDFTCTQRDIDYMKDARELFRLNGRQKMCAAHLWNVLSGNEKDQRVQEDQMEALLTALSEFIFDTTDNEPFDSGLYHFLSVLGISNDMGRPRLRPAKTYAYMLAGMVYCVRAIGIEKLLPAAQRIEQGHSDRKKFQRERRRFLCASGYTPMSNMLSLLAYGKAIAYAEGNEGSTFWSADKKTFYLKGQAIELSRFRAMAQDLVAEAEKMLWQELLWIARVEDRFTVNMKGIVDDVTFARRGASFINQPSNNLCGKLEWMLTRCRQSEQGRKLQTVEGQWRETEVKRYLRRVKRFLTLLLVCVHVTSGQPGRGSEITTIRHRNGMLQDRNIYVMDGQVMTVIRYHKSQSQWDTPKIVPRFLPPQLGQVMVVYLAYLQPFQEYLTMKVFDHSRNDYVWADEGGPWETDHLTRALERETGKRLGVRLHTLDYRHTAVGIGRVVVGETFSKGYKDDVGEVEEPEVDDDGEDVLELQNARSTATGVGTYSVPMNIIKHLSVRSIDAFRPLSTMWHRFLGLTGNNSKEKVFTGGDSSSETAEWNVVRREKRAGTANEHSNAWRHDMGLVLRERWGSAGSERAEALRKAMQQVLGREEVNFRSVEQERAVNAVLDRQTPLVVVLPTGGGKSLLFMLPALVEEGGVTVVVVPYRQLITSTVERMQACGIDCIEWRSGNTDPASIVVVSADKAGDIISKGNFLSYAQLLFSKGLLRRVVVDECHLIFTSSNWRPRLAAVKNLRLLRCPMVLLTATLPPVRELELEQSMALRCATYIRASTARLKTRYFVSWCDPGKLEDVSLTICQREMRRLLKDSQRGVVYCLSKPRCKELADILGCPYYHADVPDRNEPIERWLKHGGLITATSALGTGVDYPDIVYIMHEGMPWSMTDYAQESGRGGRGGEQVDSIILVEHGTVEKRMLEKAEDLDVQAMGVFLLGNGCRRELMSGYMDATAAGCNDVASAGCDRCGEGVSIVGKLQEEASTQWEQVETIFDELRGGCVLCCMLDEGGSSEWRQHRTMQCKVHAREGVTGLEVDRFRKRITDRTSKNNCRKCWVSQKYCATGEDKDKGCQWPNVVVPLARAAAQDSKGVAIIRQCGYSGEFGGEWKEYAVWLGKQHRERVWGELFSNAMVVAIRVAVFIAENCVE